MHDSRVSDVVSRYCRQTRDGGFHDARRWQCKLGRIHPHMSVSKEIDQGMEGATDMWGATMFLTTDIVV